MKYKKNPEREKWREIEKEVCQDCPDKKFCSIDKGTCPYIKSYISDLMRELKAGGDKVEIHKKMGWLWVFKK